MERAAPEPVHSCENMMKNDVSAEYVRSVLRYDPWSGVMRWRVSPAQVVPKGSIAGTPHKLGYVMISIKRYKYCAHRLAWLYMRGKWPLKEVDHINLDKSDNRWVNLRSSSRHDNCMNAKARRTNKCGFKGVYQRGDRFQAFISIRGKRTNLGIHDTPEEAHAAYITAAHTHFGEFARSS